MERRAKAGPFLTAREAAERLGVKPATLYAYVARGLLTSEPDGPRRARKYAVREVEALRHNRKIRRSPEAAARAALFWGTPVIESGISCVHGGRLYYRGRDATELAECATFEQVAWLLWTGALPPCFDPAAAASHLSVPPSAAPEPRTWRSAPPAGESSRDERRFDTS
jgi:citrate synthase